MKKKNKTDKFGEKVLKSIPAGLYGLLSATKYIIGDFLAFLFLPGFNMSENMVSELGVGPGGIFFNLGLIFSGIVAIPFFIRLGRSFRDEIGCNENLRKSATIASFISITSYILIGFFPAISGYEIIYFIHGTLSLMIWLNGMVFMTLFSILMLKDSKFSKLLAYYGFFIVGIHLLFLFTWVPLTEWILTFAIISWIIVNASYMLHHKI